MADRMPEAEIVRHRLLAESPPTRMAKADLPKAEMPDWSVRVGCAIKAVMLAEQLSLKEFADKVGRHPRQVARWFEGKENPQLAPIFAVAAFRQPLVIALASLAGDQVEIETHIRIKRRA